MPFQLSDVTPTEWIVTAAVAGAALFGAYKFGSARVSGLNGLPSRKPYIVSGGNEDYQLYEEFSTLLKAVTFAKKYARDPRRRYDAVLVYHGIPMEGGRIVRRIQESADDSPRDRTGHSHRLPNFLRSDKWWSRMDKFEGSSGLGCACRGR